MLKLDSWNGESNTIVNGDALQAVPKLESNSIDMTLFSPPYDDVRDYQGGWTFNYQSLGEQLYRATKEGGVCAVVIGDGTKDFAKSLTSFRLAVNWCDVVGWRLFETVIYQRHGNPGAWWTKRFRVDHEYILIFFKGKKPKYFSKEHLLIPSKHAGKIYSGTDRLTNGGFKQITPKAVNDKKCRGTIWSYATSNTEGNRTKLKHPATYPDKLAEELILTFTEPNDLVLDPMCGSGTTCVMARKNQRNYLGFEISGDYAQIAEDRLEREAGYEQLRLT